MNLDMHAMSASGQLTAAAESEVLTTAKRGRISGRSAEGICGVNDNDSRSDPSSARGSGSGVGDGRQRRGDNGIGASAGTVVPKVIISALPAAAAKQSRWGR